MLHRELCIFIAEFSLVMYPEFLVDTVQMGADCILANIKRLGDFLILHATCKAI